MSEWFLDEDRMDFYFQRVKKAFRSMPKDKGRWLKQKVSVKESNLRKSSSYIELLSNN